MSFKTDLYNQGLQYMPYITDKLMVMRDDALEQFGRPLEYHGVLNPEAIGMNAKQIKEDTENNGSREIIARSILWKAADVADDYVRKNGKTEEAYTIAEQTYSKLIEDFRNNEQDAIERMQLLASYDPDEGGTTAVVKMNDGNYWAKQTMLDYATPDKYGFGTLVSESAKQMTIIGAGVMGAEYLSDRANVLGNHVKQQYALQSQGLFGQVASLGIAMIASTAETAVAGALAASVIGSGVGVSALAQKAKGIGKAVKNVEKIISTVDKTKDVVNTTKALNAARSLRRWKNIITQTDLGLGVVAGNYYDNVYYKDDTNFMQSAAEYATKATVFHGLNRISTSLARNIGTNKALISNGADKRIMEEITLLPEWDTYKKGLNGAVANIEEFVSKNADNTKLINRVTDIKTTAIRDFILDQGSITKNLIRSGTATAVSTGLEMLAVTGATTMYEDLYGPRFRRLMDISEVFKTDPNLTEAERTSMQASKLTGIAMLLGQKMFGSVMNNVSDKIVKRKDKVDYVGTSNWRESVSNVPENNFKRLMSWSNELFFGNTVANVDAALRENAAFKSRGYTNLAEALSDGQNGKMAIAMGLYANEMSYGTIERVLGNSLLKSFETEIGGKSVKIFNHINDMDAVLAENNVITRLLGFGYSTKKFSDEEIDDVSTKIAKSVLGLNDDLTFEQDVDINTRILRAGGVLQFTDKKLATAVFSKLNKLGNITDINQFKVNGNIDELKLKTYRDATKGFLNELTKADFSKTVDQESTVMEWYKQKFPELGIRRVSEDSALLGRIKSWEGVIEKVNELNSIGGFKETELSIITSAAKSLEDIMNAKGYDNLKQIDETDIEQVIKSMQNTIVKKIKANTEELVRLSEVDPEVKETENVKIAAFNLVEQNRVLSSMYGLEADVAVARDTFLRTIKDRPNVRNLVNESYRKITSITEEDSVRAIVEKMTDSHMMNVNARQIDYMLQKTNGNQDFLELASILVSKEIGINDDVDTSIRKLLNVSAYLSTKNEVLPQMISSRLNIKGKSGNIDSSIAEKVYYSSMIKDIDTIVSNLRGSGFTEDVLTDSVASLLAVRKSLSFSNVKELLKGNQVNIDEPMYAAVVKLNDKNNSIDIEVTRNTFDKNTAQAEVSKMLERESIDNYNSILDKRTKHLYRDSLYAVIGENRVTLDTAIELLEKQLYGAAKGNLDTMIDIAREYGKSFPGQEIDKSVEFLAKSITNGTSGSIRLIDENGRMNQNNENLVLALLKNENRKRTTNAIKWNIYTDEVTVSTTDEFASNRLSDNVLIDIEIPDYIKEAMTEDQVKKKILSNLKDSNLFYTGLQYSNAQTMLYVRVPVSTKTELKSWLVGNSKRYLGTVFGKVNDVEDQIYKIIDSKVSEITEGDMNRDRVQSVFSSTMDTIVRDVFNPLKEKFKKDAEEFKFKEDAINTTGLLGDIQKSLNDIVPLFNTISSRLKNVDSITRYILKNPSTISNASDADVLKELNNLFDEAVNNKNAFESKINKLTDSNDEISKIVAMTKLMQYVDNDLRNTQEVLLDAEKVKEIDGAREMFDKLDIKHIPMLVQISKKAKKNYEYLSKFIDGYSAIKNPESKSNIFIRGMHTGFTTLYGDHPGKRPITQKNSIFMKDGVVSNEGKNILKVLSNLATKNGGYVEFYLTKDPFDKEDGQIYLHEDLMKTYYATLSASTGEKLFMSNDGVVLKGNITQYVGDNKKSVKVFDTRLGRLVDKKFISNDNILSLNAFKEYSMDFMKALGIDGAINSKADAVKISISKKQIEDAMNNAIPVDKQAEAVMKILLGLSTHADTKTVVGDGEYSVQAANMGDVFSSSIAEALRVNADLKTSESLDFKPTYIGKKVLDGYKSAFHQTYNYRMSGMIDAWHLAMENRSNTTSRFGFTKLSDKLDEIGDAISLGSIAIGKMLEKVASDNYKNPRSKRMGEIASSLIDDKYIDITDLSTKLKTLSEIDAELDALVKTDANPNGILIKEKVGEQYMYYLAQGKEYTQNELSNTRKNMSVDLEDIASDNRLKQVISTGATSLNDEQKAIRTLMRRLVLRNATRYDRHIKEAFKYLSDETIMNDGALIQSHGDGIFTMLSSRFPAQKIGQMGVSFIRGITRGTAGLYVNPTYWERVKNADFDGDTGNFNAIKASDIMKALNLYAKSVGRTETDIIGMAKLFEADALNIASMNKSVFPEVSESFSQLEKFFSLEANAPSGLPINTLEAIPNLAYAVQDIQNKSITLNDIAELKIPMESYLGTTNISSNGYNTFKSDRVVLMNGDPSDSYKLKGSFNFIGVSRTNKEQKKIIVAKSMDGGFFAIDVESSKELPVFNINSIKKIEEGDIFTIVQKDYDIIREFLKPNTDVTKEFNANRVTSLTTINDYIQSGPVDNVKGFGLNVMLTKFKNDLGRVESFIEDVAFANKMGVKVNYITDGEAVTIKDVYSGVSDMPEDISSKFIGQKDLRVRIDDLYIDNIRQQYYNGSANRLSKMEMKELMKLNKNKSINANDLRKLNIIFTTNENKYLNALGDRSFLPSRVKDSINKLALFNKKGLFKTIKFEDNFDDDIKGLFIGGIPLPIEVEEGKIADPYGVGVSIIDSYNSLRVLNDSDIADALKKYQSIAGLQVNFDVNTTSLIAEAAKTYVNSPQRTFVGVTTEDVKKFISDMGFVFESKASYMTNEGKAELYRTVADIQLVENDNITNTIGGLKLVNEKRFATHQELFDRATKTLNANKNSMLKDKYNAIFHGLVSSMDIVGRKYMAISTTGLNKDMIGKLNEQIRMNRNYSDIKISKDMIIGRFNHERSNNMINYKFNIDIPDIVMKGDICGI